MVDPLTHTARWAVRSYELDRNGHVNNAVYLSWAEELTNQHAERAGYGREWCLAHGGSWVVHHSEITYHAPAEYGDDVSLTVRVEMVRGVRGVRRTWIRREPGGELLAEVLTEWAWIRLSDGRPAPVPDELVRMAAAHTAEFLASPQASALRARARGTRDKR